MAHSPSGKHTTWKTPLREAHPLQRTSSLLLLTHTLGYYYVFIKIDLLLFFLSKDNNKDDKFTLRDEDYKL